MGKLKAILFGSLVLAFVSLSSFEHEYYVSIANINLKTEKNQLQIELKIDADDLENVLLKEEGKKVNFEEINEKDRKLLIGYLNKHLVIWVNGASLKLSSIGEELNPDGSLWCYLIAELPAVTQTIKIKNDLLLPQFNQQHNIVNLKSNGKVQSHTFVINQTTHIFKIDAK